MSRNWSEQQKAIFEWCEKEEGNLTVVARAGTGKTTTILEGVRHMREESILVAAFNKRIAKELQTKLGRFPRAEVKTLHGVGFSVVRRYWERVRVEGDRGYDIAREVAGDSAPDIMIGKIQKLAGIAKGMVVDLAPADRREDRIEDLIDLAMTFDVEEPDDSWQKAGWTLERIAALTCDALEKAREIDPRGARIDFDDMIYLPIVNGWAQPTYNAVVVDEAQDMTATQLELARRVCLPNGRFMVVGDDKQAIYGFRGADSGALARLKKELNAKELGLTTTYRCGKAIAAYAKTLVPDFNAADTNPPGLIERLHMSQLVTTAQPGDFVLSRKNAPLVSTCLRLLRAGKPARVEGKDVAAGLRSIAKRWKSRTVADLMEKIQTWSDREIKKLWDKVEAGQVKESYAKGKEEVIEDQAAVLLALCEGIAQPAELLTRLDTMFGDSEDDPRPAVVCSSIHRAKGLEASRVFVLQETLYLSRKSRAGAAVKPDIAAARANASQEERNLEYVAVTRAINTLVWVTEKEAA